jgi:hypothetical protein
MLACWCTVYLLIVFIFFINFFFLQVAASTQKEADAHIPNYPNLPSRLVCHLENVTLHVCSLRPALSSFCC